MGIHGHHLPQPPLPESKTRRNTVRSLYKALARGNLNTVGQLLDQELEWWYHGPPNCHHMMLMLTGKSKHRDYRFRPRSITTVGELVIVEGWEEEIMRAYWVHVWTVKDGQITEFREYFNTWLTVILQVPGEDGKENVKAWQSEPQQRLNWSLPDLVLTV
ncbi:wound-induced protein 1-like [Rhododendron vialii]|uniref:wound-induced protein 1-like n=1 Tax=Rhododendron vialii TaxID=182163 RepID=UPI00265EC3F4|nr:wound-induced protein 1-like [Rhododendron vialii]